MNKCGVIEVIFHTYPHSYGAHQHLVRLFFVRSARREEESLDSVEIVALSRVYKGPLTVGCGDAERRRRCFGDAERGGRVLRGAQSRTLPEEQGSDGVGLGEGDGRVAVLRVV